MASAVHVTYYNSAFQEAVETDLQLPLPDGQRIRMPINAPGQMIASFDATSTATWEAIADAFPAETKWGGGVAIVSVIGEDDVLLYVGRDKSKDPEFWEYCFAGTQRAYGLNRGDVVKLKDIA